MHLKKVMNLKKFMSWKNIDELKNHKLEKKCTYSQFFTNLKFFTIKLNEKGEKETK